VGPVPSKQPRMRRLQTPSQTDPSELRGTAPEPLSRPKRVALRASCCFAAGTLAVLYTDGALSRGTQRGGGGGSPTLAPPPRPSIVRDRHPPVCFARSCPHSHPNSPFGLMPPLPRIPDGGGDGNAGGPPTPQPPVRDGVPAAYGPQGPGGRAVPRHHRPRPDPTAPQAPARGSQRVCPPSFFSLVLGFRR